MDDRVFKGYGRGWGEEKATGIARFFQIMREPASQTSWVICAAGFIAVYFFILTLFP